MDEVRIEGLIQKYKDNGKLNSEDPALVMLKMWPGSKQYRENSDRLPGLEQLVCNLCTTIEKWPCLIGFTIVFCLT